MLIYICLITTMYVVMHEFKWMLIISLWFFSTQTQSSTWNSISSCHLTTVFSVGHYNNCWPPELFSQRGFCSDNDLSLRSKPIMLKQGNSMANVVFSNSHSTLTEYMAFPLKQLWKIKSFCIQHIVKSSVCPFIIGRCIF